MAHRSTSFARRLRTNMTDAERRLWMHLRRKQLEGARFQRQRPVGPYIVDFCCNEARLIVELDGGQHDAHREKDMRRTRDLEEFGYRIVRFWNNEVFENLEWVLETIAAAVRRCESGPPP